MQDDVFTVNGEKFKLTPQTSIIGEKNLKEGRHATVYFRKSGSDNLAAKIILSK